MPKRTVEELHVTAVPGVTGFTVMLVVPLLGRLLTSPPYSAWMVMMPALTAVTVMEHEPDAERLHVAGLGRVTLPVPHWVKVTVPVGYNPPDTVAVHDVVEPMTKGVGVQETTVVVETCVAVI
jgi:hypothetical protein